MGSGTPDHKQRSATEDGKRADGEHDDETGHAAAAPLMFSPGDSRPLPDGRREDDHSS
ncbi:MAG: hypothetical protein ABEJ67_07050 [Halanaeroarchaeum sp.]